VRASDIAPERHQQKDERCGAQPSYSFRSAVTGFTRAARVAGINAAADATTSTTAPMIPPPGPDGRRSEKTQSGNAEARQ